MTAEELDQLEDEDLLLALEPNTYYERDGAVYVCGASGLRGCMSKEAWDYIRSRYPATGDQQ